MERNPVRFVWKTTRALHAAAIALLLIAIPILWLGLDLVRVAIDDAIAGRVFDGRSAAPFLRVALTLPERIAEEPIVFLQGISLDRGKFVMASVAALLAVALALSIGALLFGAIQTVAGARVLARLRRTIVDGIVGARPSAREDVRHAAALAGEGLAREGAFLGSAVLTPAVGATIIAVALIYAGSVDWWLSVALAATLLIIAFVWPRRLDALSRLSDSRTGEGAALRRLLVDLGRRLPAMRAHGTAGFERSRVSEDLAVRRQSARPAERDASAAAALTTLASAFVLVAIVAAGAWVGPARGITAGEMAAVLAAAAAAVLALDRMMDWQRGVEASRRLFEEIARALGGFQSRGRAAQSGALPGSGVLAAEGVAAYDPATGARITGVNLSIVMPAHVALVDGSGGSAKLFAGLVGGQIDPSVGRLTFAGVDLPFADPGERARRIAYAGGDTILIAGTLRQNLLYGCQDAAAADIDQRLLEAVTTAGLDGFVHARGLAGTVDPKREHKLASALVDARRAVQAAITSENLRACVEPFDPQRYNHNATVGENILFGVPLGDTFRESNLPSHPFVRAILESEGLTKPLTAMGTAVAQNIIEIFADIPDGHPLFDRFSFFTAAERSYFQDLIERKNERRRDAESSRDRERLIGLALRYSENRHRLGLLDADTERRLVGAREAFAKLLPLSLQPAIEFYHPDRICAAASVQDNLLFGRIAQDRAGAETEVRALIQRVLTNRGLNHEVFRVGLDSRIDIRGDGLDPREIAAIDLARCLVRRPDIVVVERALDGLSGPVAEDLIKRLRRAMIGRGLVIVTASLPPNLDQPPFDSIVRFESGGTRIEDRRSSQTTALEPA